MQALLRAVRSCQETLKLATDAQTSLWRGTAKGKLQFPRLGCAISTPIMGHSGLENTTVQDVLMIKEGENDGSWLWCRCDDSIHDAVKQMAQHNVGSLVVMKPGDPQLIAGILTERDYLRKVAAQGRHAKYTRVGEIMTDENKLITVTSDMKVLEAMQLMTEHHVRHVPVVDGKMVGMISMHDVVKAVLEQQSGEMKRLNEFIKGEYY